MSEINSYQEVIEAARAAYEFITHNREFVVSCAMITAGMVGICITKRQREWILRRDNDTSQMRHYSEEKGWHCKDPSTCSGCDSKGCPREVHHINPQGNGGVNRPQNLITLQRCEHTGKTGKGGIVDIEKEFVVHPDNIQALNEYRRGNKDAYKQLIENRQEQTRRGEKYWNDDHDEEMKQTAEERTNNETMKGCKFPKKK